MSKNICIAGAKTIADWELLRPKLIAPTLDLPAWNEAKEFMNQRINTRYLESIEALRNHGPSLKGEGFAICTIICSLIEAIETFYTGKNFTTKPTNEFEYGSRKSGNNFNNFLTTRKPFSEYFDKALAKDFYANVRCALLHEACTRNGWVINIREHETIVIKNGTKTLNRSLFVADLKECIKRHNKELDSSEELREAFLRKFDGICANSM